MTVMYLGLMALRIPHIARIRRSVSTLALQISPSINKWMSTTNQDRHSATML